MFERSILCVPFYSDKWYNSIQQVYNSTIVQFIKNKYTSPFIDKYTHKVVETGNVYQSCSLSNTLTVLF